MMSYKHETGFFEVPLSYEEGADSDKKLKLYYQRWVPSSNAKSEHDLVVHHGLGEHSSRYGNILGALEGTGISIYSYDIRGHGQSGGKKGLGKDVPQYAEDLKMYLDFIEEEFRVTKPLLYGHSMGGAAVLTLISNKSNQERLKAVVATGSALGVDKNFYQTVMVGLLSCLRHLIPGVTLPSGLDVKNLSHDANYVESYKSDPLTHDLIAVSLAFSVVNGGDEIIKTASNVTLPIFLAHGESDIICTARGTQAYYDKCASTDKTLKIYPGLFHEIHNETKEEREKVLADIKSFIVDHMK